METKQLTAQELTSILYDTLMRNTDYPQFNIDESEDEFVNDEEGSIYFTYRGAEYRLNLEKI